MTDEDVREAVAMRDSAKSDVDSHSSLLTIVNERAALLVQQEWCSHLIEIEGVDADALTTHYAARLKGLPEEAHLFRLARRVALQRERVALDETAKRKARWAYVVVLAVATVGGLVSGILLRTGWGVLVGIWLLLSVTLWVPDWVRDRERRRLGIEDAPAALSRCDTDLDRSLRGFLEQSVRSVIKPVFVPPNADFVTAWDGSHLSSRVAAGERVMTRSRPGIEQHMLRVGGAAIGLTGERGIGKSEILRSFCCETGATVEDGGTIGVFTAVPAPFVGLDFLRVLTRALIEAIPGYETPLRRQERRLEWTGRTLAIAGWILLMIGVWAVIFSAPFVSLTVRWLWCLAIVGGSAVYVAGIVLANRSGRFSVLRRLTSAESDPSPAMLKRLPIARRVAARNAAGLMTRLRYAETISTQSEGSFSWKDVGLKQTRERSLSQIPLSEADVISEFADLTKLLEQVGYRVIIGIDEMDKLEAGADTEAFLNSIKQLFAIRSCSFLVTVSSSAYIQFVRRGTNIRDALDSSLDAIVPLDSFDFIESRSMIRHRREDLSDGQILFCHALSGGLPRELMRCARSLALLNNSAGPRDLASRGQLLLELEFEEVLRASLEHAATFEPPLNAEIMRVLTAIDCGRRTNPWTLMQSPVLGVGVPADAVKLVTDLQRTGRFLACVEHVLCAGYADVVSRDEWNDRAQVLGEELARIRREMGQGVTDAHEGLAQFEPSEAAAAQPETVSA